MKTSNYSRRNFVRDSGAALGLLPFVSFSRSASGGAAPAKKIVCVGAHPDDPESGCGGTLARLANAGNALSIIYLTTGEAGIANKSHAEAAAIRKEEAIRACAILRAKPVFAGQIDGDTLVNNEWISTMAGLLEAEKPDLVFTHWPLDTHPDHQVASLLVIQSWRRAQKKFPLYFYEVCAGEQTMGFHPTDFMDISDTQEQKRRAVYCHASQDPPDIYACGHAAMEDFRGRQLGVKAAEGFIRMTGQGQGSLLQAFT
jgi:LmbE family N-acetylglucosaminyl deacetylase